MGPSAFSAPLSRRGGRCLPRRLAACCAGRLRGSFGPGSSLPRRVLASLRHASVSRSFAGPEARRRPACAPAPRSCLLGGVGCGAAVCGGFVAAPSLPRRVLASLRHASVRRSFGGADRFRRQVASRVLGARCAGRRRAPPGPARRYLAVSSLRSATPRSHAPSRGPRPAGARRARPLLGRASLVGLGVVLPSAAVFVAASSLPRRVLASLRHASVRRSFGGADRLRRQPGASCPWACLRPTGCWGRLWALRTRLVATSPCPRFAPPRLGLTLLRPARGPPAPACRRDRRARGFAGPEALRRQRARLLHGPASGGCYGGFVRGTCCAVRLRRHPPLDDHRLGCSCARCLWVRRRGGV